ncbi:PHP domain-containing protein [Halanaerobium sp. ST460_2HS_T2]|uniref:PHP domain-containing protein n=1 Tax=Halanaerobium sp. ST460_2HS_T2 TaxID=2183914 RepID=UPI000DF3CA36|nr:PHP domain-containing protein [Halanaerobium sp. ST460_2HS_T2]
MQRLKADLHLHSVLSPCGDLLMTPLEIVKKAKSEGIEVVALTDHNSAENVEVFKYHCENHNLNFIPAMEVETKEEIHILCYFPDLMKLFEWQQIVYDSLPNQANDEDFFGPQIKCDYNDQFQSKVNRLLAAAVDLNLEKCLNMVCELGGLVVPSHLDRKNSIVSQLGFIPPTLELSTVEISKNTNPEFFLNKFPFIKNLQFMQNSDSHYLKEIKAYQQLVLKEFSFVEFKKTLQKKDGRKIELIKT